MVKKTNAQLMEEIKSLKESKLKERIKFNKELQSRKERKELEQELKELRRSKIFKKVKKFSSKQLTKEQLERRGKQATENAKIFWKAAGKVVNKLDKIKL